MLLHASTLASLVVVVESGDKAGNEGSYHRPALSFLDLLASVNKKQDLIRIGFINVALQLGLFLALLVQFHADVVVGGDPSSDSILSVINSKVTGRTYTSSYNPSPISQ
jgi:hypothetical protein